MESAKTSSSSSFKSPVSSKEFQPPVISSVPDREEEKIPDIKRDNFSAVAFSSSQLHQRPGASFFNPRNTLPTPLKGSAVFSGPDSVMKAFHQGQCWICFKEGVRFTPDGKRFYEKIYLDIGMDIPKMVEENFFDFEGQDVSSQLQAFLEAHPDAITQVFFSKREDKSRFKEEELACVEVSVREILFSLASYLFKWILYGLGVQESPRSYQKQLAPPFSSSIDPDEIEAVKQEGLLQRSVLDALTNKLVHCLDTFILPLRGNGNQNDRICSDIKASGGNYHYSVCSYDADPRTDSPYKHQFAVIIDTSHYTVSFIDSLNKDWSHDSQLKELVSQLTKQHRYPYKIVNCNSKSLYTTQSMNGPDRSLCGLYTFKNICDFLEGKTTGGRNKKLTVLEIDVEIAMLLQLSKPIEAETYLHEDVRKTYRAHYQFLEIPMQETRYPIRDIYTNLTLITEATEQKTSGSATLAPVFEFERDTLAESMNQLHKNKQSILLKEIFEPRGKEKKSAKKVLMVGRAGVGKTTLCKKIAYEWADNQLWVGQFKSVLLISFRELNESIKSGKRLDPLQFNSKQAWLREVIIELCIIRGDKRTEGNRAILRESFNDYFSHFKDKILVVWDGYDEASHLSRETLQGLLQEDKAHDNPMHFIILSRPGNLQAVSPIMDMRIETTGFSEEQVKEYVHRFYQVTFGPGALKDRAEDIESLLNELKKNLMMKALASVPIQLQMLCCLWEEVKRQGGFSGNVTQLYQQMMDQFYRWILKRQCPSPDTFLDDAHNKIQVDRVCALLKELQKESLSHAYRVMQHSTLSALIKTYTTPDLNEARWIEVLTEKGFLKKRFASPKEPLYVCVIKMVRVFLAIHEKNGAAEMLDYKQQLFSVMSEVAEQGFQTGQLVMSSEMVETVLRESDHSVQLQDLLDSGLLISIKSASTSAYTFMHLTFQEYLVAYYHVMKRSPQEITAWVQTHKYQPRYQLVLQFMCGLTMREKGNAGVKHFIGALEQPPRDMIGVYHDILVARCLNECGEAEEIYRWVNDIYRLVDRLEHKLKLDMDSYSRDKSEFIKSELYYLPHLYRYWLIGFFIRRLGSDKYKNEAAMKILIELGVPKGKKVEIFVRLLEESSLETLRHHVTYLHFLDGVSQPEADALVEKLASRWPAKKTSDISVNYTLEIARVTVTFTSHGKKLVLVEKLIGMLDVEYKCREAAKILSEIGMPVPDTIMTGLLREASYDENAFLNHYLFKADHAKEHRRDECVEVLAYLNRVIPQHHLNTVFKIFMDGIKKEYNYKYLYTIKHIILVFSEFQGEQIFLHLFIILSNEKNDKKDKEEIMDIFLECYGRVPLVLKCRFLQFYVEYSRKINIKFVIETILCDDSLPTELRYQVVRASLRKAFRYDSYENKKTLTSVLQQLNEATIIILFEEFFITEAGDLICGLLQFYPKDRLHQLFGKLIQNLESKESHVASNASKTISHLLQEKTLLRMERQLLFHLLCDALEKKSDCIIIILDTFHGVGKEPEACTEELEPCIPRLLAIQINLLKKNIGSGRRELISKLLDFGGFWNVVKTDKDNHGRTSKTFSFCKNDRLLTPQQLMLMAELSSLCESIDLNWILRNLQQCLNHKDSVIRFETIKVLETLATQLSDEKIKEVVAWIQPCVSDPDSNIATYAQNVIMKLYARIKVHDKSSSWISIRGSGLLENLLERVSGTITSLLGSDHKHDQIDCTLQDLEHLLSCCTKVEYEKGLVENYENDNWMAQPYVEGTVRSTSSRDDAYKRLIHLIVFLPQEKVVFVIERIVKIIWREIKDDDTHSWNYDSKDNVEKAVLSLHAICQKLPTEQCRSTLKTLLDQMKPSGIAFSNVIKIIVEFRHLITEAQTQAIVVMYFKLLEGAKEMLIIVLPYHKHAFIQELIALAENNNKAAVLELRMIFNDVPLDKRKKVFQLLFKDLSKYDLEKIYINLPTREGQVTIIECLKEILSGHPTEEETVKVAEVLKGKNIPENDQVFIVNALLRLPAKYNAKSINENVMRFLDEMSVSNLLRVYLSSDQSTRAAESALLDKIEEICLKSRVCIVCHQISDGLLFDIYDKSNTDIVRLQFPRVVQAKFEKLREAAIKNLGSWREITYSSSQTMFFNVPMLSQNNNSASIEEKIAPRLINGYQGM